MNQQNLAYVATMTTVGVMAGMVIMRDQMRHQLRPVAQFAASRSEIARRLICKIRGMDYYSGRHRLAVTPA
jgi:hypothetical protein